MEPTLLADYVILFAMLLIIGSWFWLLISEFCNILIELKKKETFINIHKFMQFYDETMFET